MVSYIPRDNRPQLFHGTDLSRTIDVLESMDVMLYLTIIILDNLLVIALFFY